MQSGLSLRFSAWVVFNADGPLEIYLKNKQINKRFVSTIIISEKRPVLFGYFVHVLVSVLAKMRACSVSYEPSLLGKINAVGLLASL